MKMLKKKIIILITCVEPLFERYRYLSGFLEEEDVSERNGFVESSGVAVGVIAFTHNTSGWSCREKRTLFCSIVPLGYLYIYILFMNESALGTGIDLGMDFL